MAVSLVFVTRRWLLAVAAACVACAACGKRAPRTDAPAGFIVESVAPVDSLAGFTFDHRGRPVVWKTGGGSATLLADTTGDGVVDTERVLSRDVRPRAVWFDGPALYAVGVNNSRQCGLYRVAEGEFALLSAFANPNCAGPFDLRRSVDGALLVLVPDLSQIPAEQVDGAAHDYAGPLLDHQDAMANRTGAVLRWSGARFTVIARGLHAARRLAVARDGSIFTTDEESDRSAARLFRLTPGAEYGWRPGAAALPGYYFDVAKPEREWVRPTAPARLIEIYQHDVFPAAYHGARFEAAAGGGIRVGDGPEWLRTDGEVTALEVGPDGALYFIAGGELRRVRVSARPAAAPSRELTRYPQPLSSWSHGALEREKELLGQSWAERLEAVAADARATAADRAEAVRVLERFGARRRSTAVKTPAPVTPPEWETLPARVREMDALRWFGIRAAAGDAPPEVCEAMTKAVLGAGFPQSPDRRLNGEWARVLGYCGGGDAVDALLAALPRAEADRPWQIHLARCLRAVKRGWSSEDRATFAAWERRLPAGILAQTADAPKDGPAMFALLCARCHAGGGLGPELSEIGPRFPGGAQLLEAIREPSKEVAERYAAVAVETNSGDRIEGLVVREDARELVLRTAADLKRPVTVSKRQIKSRAALDHSLMPAGLLDGYDDGDVAKLIEFIRAGAALRP
ncbi:MAG: hypothetical protein IT162_13295 [Bryobacterales bacterium]|nr:hypothetical protein [Bryobacterales bacterium]